MRSLEWIRADEAAREKAQQKKGRKTKAGRPRSEFPERYQVRCTAEQFGAWVAAASADGRDLQNWIRWTLDKASKKKPR
jgi:hypothetical protein